MGVIKQLIFIVCIFLIGCALPIPGGAGSIKGYRYQTTKDKLENAIKTVIKNNKNIYRDSIKNYIVDMTNNKKDTMDDNMYNDGKNYMTIKIKEANIENEYTFRFYGDEEYWKTSPSSEIFIVYAYDKTGKGGSEGHGDIDNQLRKKLTDVFESEFINKIDKELNMKDSTINSYSN